MSSVLCVALMLLLAPQLAELASSTTAHICHVESAVCRAAVCREQLGLVARDRFFKQLLFGVLPAGGKRASLYSMKGIEATLSRE